MHPRLALNQIPFLGRSTADFLSFCAGADIASAVLFTPAAAADLAAQPGSGPRIEALVQVFSRDLSQAGKSEQDTLMASVATAAALGARSIYMLTGGRGPLSWDEAAARFAELIAPCREAAAQSGVALLIENAPALYADLHIGHGLEAVLALAERARIGVCIELADCWAEAGIERRLRRAAPLAGLVQVSDYVLGDRALPTRAVPGDGAIPLDRLCGTLLDAGYQGVFDIELVGPRIEAEGVEPACRRAAERVSEMLVRLGA